MQAYNTGQNNMLILQESCIDSSGSLVVYCPVDLPAINIAMSGEDPSYIPLLPSGFTITPDGRAGEHLQPGPDGASTSSTSIIDKSSSSGSLITVVFQILVSSLPSARMSPETVTTVNNLIGNTVHQIKGALNCSTCWLEIGVPCCEDWMHKYGDDELIEKICRDWLMKELVLLVGGESSIITYCCCCFCCGLATFIYISQQPLFFFFLNLISFLFFF